ncbi:hypothetical protein DY000_02031231 [Brassica cretica]|uniref:Uncharacterized protein n=1 Tax=Brassica cretica TaxID=69181 RepID=A0ABQ7DXM7_BRACR|nr:hypothetical protein DY000_02031231 [Brassica cretica]
MHGFVSYRHFWRVRLLRNDRASYVSDQPWLRARSLRSDRAAFVLGRYDDQIIPTDVQEADRSRQTDQAMYRIDPLAAGKELRLELRPDDRTYRTGACLPWPTHQAMTNGRARTHFDRVETETDHSLSLFAQILQLSIDLGRAGTKFAHEPYPTDCPDRAATVLLLTTKEPLGSDEPGR